MESGGKAVTKRYRKKITVALSLVLPVIVLFAILNCFTTYVFYEDYKMCIRDSALPASSHAWSLWMSLLYLIIPFSCVFGYSFV